MGSVSNICTPQQTALGPFADDRIRTSVYPSEAQFGSDPLVHWEKVGKKLEDGIIAYSTLAIDPDVSDAKF